MTFPIEKRINTELFIEERPELYIQNGNKKSKDKIEELAAKTNKRWE